jgi:hypothetical protein
MDIFNGGSEEFDEVESGVEVSLPICECCNIPLSPHNDTLYTCQQCGKTERRMFNNNYYDLELNKCFNVNPHNNNPIIIKGVSKLSIEQHNVNKDILNTNVIEKIAGIRQTILSWNIMLHEANNHIEIPTEVVDSATEAYKEMYVKKHIKLRGKRITSLLIVLVHFEGVKQQTFIDKYALGKIVGIKSNNDITKALKVVYSLSNYYDIPEDEDIFAVQLKQYFSDLGVDEKYLDFVNKMLEATSQSNLNYSGNYSRETTRYAALIYIIGLNTSPIPHKKIWEVCGVASTTFKGHVSFLSRHSDKPEIAQILEEYDIKL